MPTFYDIVATEISPELRELFEEIQSSGQSESIGVVEILDTIASNGGDQATAEFIQACAQEVRDAAQAVLDRIGPIIEKELCVPPTEETPQAGSGERVSLAKTPRRQPPWVSQIHSEPGVDRNREAKLEQAERDEELERAHGSRSMGVEIGKGDRRIRSRRLRQLREGAIAVFSRGEAAPEKGAWILVLKSPSHRVHRATVLDLVCQALADHRRRRPNPPSSQTSPPAETSVYWDLGIPS